MNRVSVIYTIFKDKEFTVKNNGHSLFLTLYGIDLELFYKFPISSIISSLNAIFEECDIVVNDVKYLPNNFNRDQKQINAFKTKIEEYWIQKGYSLNPNIEATYNSGAASKVKDLIDKYNDTRSLDNILSAHIDEYNQRIEDKKAQCEKNLLLIEKEYEDKINELNDDLELKKHEAELYIEGLRDKMRKEKATFVESHQDDVTKLNKLIEQINDANAKLKASQLKIADKNIELNKIIHNKNNEIKILDTKINELKQKQRATQNEYAKAVSLLDSVNAKYGIAQDTEKNLSWLKMFSKDLEKELDATVKIYNELHREYDKAKLDKLDDEITQRLKKNKDFIKEKFNF